MLAGGTDYELDPESNDPNQVTLPEFITLMKKRHKQKHELLKHVFDPELMIQGLEELNGLIGHDEEKLAAIDMTMYGINHLNTPKAERTEPAQLHAVFYGNPGSGKTAVAKKLAIIINGLGFLKKGEESKMSDYVKKAKDMSPEDMQNAYMWIVILVAIISVLFLILSYIWSGLSTVYNYTGWFGIGAIFLSIVALILVTWWYWPCDDCSSTDCDEANKADDADSDSVDKADKSKEKPTKKRIIDDDVIAVLGPEDLISQYFGATMAKTREVLRKNRGKVIFIDEAYGLFGIDADARCSTPSYGHDACTVLNREMSEHPEDYIIFMAGYEKLLNNTVFKAQPGLESRFMWKFSCADYAPRALFQIFEKQLKDDKWCVAPNEHAAVSSNFMKAVTDGLFLKGQARDTERLRTYCKLEYNRMLLKQTKLPKRQVTLDLLVRALQRLKQNSFKTPDPKDSKDTADTPLSKLFSDLCDRLDPEAKPDPKSHPAPSSKPTIEEVDDEEINSLT